MLKELGKDLGIPLLATNDCHYLTREDRAPTRSALHPDREDAERPVALEVRHRPALREGHRRPARGVQGRPEAIENTLQVAKRCDLELKSHDYEFPAYRPTRARRSSSASTRRRVPGLEERLAAGLRRRARARSPARPRSRTGSASSSSSQSINKLQFAGYFLIVSDFINWAKRQAIPVGPGRGSAAGSLVAYALRSPTSTRCRTS
jgi:DNA polymerase-3 subunit alpha